MSNLLRRCTFLLLLLPAFCPGQQSSGRISGVVHDASGAPVPAAAVEVTNTGTGDVRKTTSNSSGTYVLGPLPVGDYRIEASHQGFKRMTRTG
ncbi:MAG TPA: carboxypeptidase-like regulatory domain-containing protein, partial [Bryobacteraceae bacterium]|nr:carboxypeptidase-like regulatory domain-containing protein [Bryobacteraceae bacterium]